MCSNTTVRHFDGHSLTWPPKSPDLSSIEHMWDALDNRIRNRPVQPRTWQELEIWIPLVLSGIYYSLNGRTLKSMYKNFMGEYSMVPMTHPMVTCDACYCFNASLCCRGQMCYNGPSKSIISNPKGNMGCYHR